MGWKYSVGNYAGANFSHVSETKRSVHPIDKLVHMNQRCVAVKSSPTTYIEFDRDGEVIHISSTAAARCPTAGIRGTRGENDTARNHCIAAWLYCHKMRL